MQKTVSDIPVYGTNRDLTFLMKYGHSFVEESTLLKYPEIKTNIGIKNELYGMKFPKTLKHVNVWESTTIKIPIADNIMNFLFDFVRCALMEFVYPHILWLFKFSSMNLMEVQIRSRLREILCVSVMF